MPLKIITIYCFCDELLKALGKKDDPQTQMSTAEIMTIALVAAEFFVGNQQAALDFLISHGYIAPFSKSRFNRRLHRIPETLWQFALFVLAQLRQHSDPADNETIVDTFPVPVCRNIRIARCRLYRERAFRGYNASKREYFYGLKVCLVISTTGQPLELLFVPGSYADIAALRAMDLNLPEGTRLYADSGFLDAAFEQALSEEAGITLVVPRRSNMKDQLDGCLQYICSTLRKRVETTFSQLNERFARSIHAVTPRGFELKIFLTVLAFTIVG
jgi:hypothetical protein